MIGRPQQSEAAPYYWRYIELTPGTDPVAVMEAQLGLAMEIFESIDEQKSLFRYAPMKWSIRQVLNHVSDTERAFAFRALWFSRGFDSPLPSYDQEIAAAGASAHSTSWAAHIEEFRSVRQATLSLFHNMSEQGWQRMGIASDNRFTVRAMAYIIPGHVSYHLARIRTDYLKQ